MDEVYRGNGFVIETNHSDELYISLASNRNIKLRLISSSMSRDDEMLLSYRNTTVEMTPLEYKMYVIHEILGLEINGNNNTKDSSTDSDQASSGSDAQSDS